MMYFDEGVGAAFDRPSVAVNVVLGVASLATLLFWIYPAPVMQGAAAAARSLF